MTLHKRSLLSRLRAVEVVIRPRGSKKAKIAALSDADKALLEAWEKECDAWHVNYPGEKAYIAWLDYMAGKGGSSPPEMPARIARLIYPPVVKTDDPQADYQALLDSMPPPQKKSRRS